MASHGLHWLAMTKHSKQRPQLPGIGQPWPAALAGLAWPWPTSTRGLWEHDNDYGFICFFNAHRQGQRPPEGPGNMRMLTLSFDFFNVLRPDQRLPEAFGTRRRDCNIDPNMDSNMTRNMSSGQTSGNLPVTFRNPSVVTTMLTTKTCYVRPFTWVMKWGFRGMLI